jgi:hypothetical protein
VHRHVVVVDGVREPRGDLDGRVELQAAADAPPDPAPLQERRRLDRAAAHEHVLGPDEEVLGRAVGSCAGTGRR